MFYSGVFFVGECTVNLKRGQAKYRLIVDNQSILCICIHIYTYRIVWGLSLSVIIVCILWAVFFSSRLVRADYHRSSGMAGVGTIFSLAYNLVVL